MQAWIPYIVRLTHWLLLEIMTKPCYETHHGSLGSKKKARLPALRFVTEDEGHWLGSDQVERNIKKHRRLQMHIHTHVYWVWPTPCNSDHQDHCILNRGFRVRITFHCYSVGGHAQCIYEIMYIYIYTYIHISWSMLLGSTWEQVKFCTVFGILCDDLHKAMYITEKTLGVLTRMTTTI